MVNAEAGEHVKEVPVMDGWTHRQMDGHSDRWMDTETDGWAYRQMDGHKDRWMDTQMNTQTDGWKLIAMFQPA